MRKEIRFLYAEYSGRINKLGNYYCFLGRETGNHGRRETTFNCTSFGVPFELCVLHICYYLLKNLKNSIVDH